NIYNIITSNDGVVWGSTGNPMRVWQLEPKTGEMADYGMFPTGHVNQFVRQGNKLYGAIYSAGAVYEFDPTKPIDIEAGNPREVHRDLAAFNLYGRPKAVLAHPDGRHLLVGGQAARMHYGSGLLIFDTQTTDGTIIDR